MINYKKARSILKNSKINIGNELLNTNRCLNRVVAKNIYVKTYYPSENNAAFDGFVVNSNETKKLSNKFTKKFKIIGSIAAGNKPIKKAIKKFNTIEIMTGGLIPKSFDAIVPIEKAEFYPNKNKPKYIILNQRVRKYSHVRFKGSDYKKNDLLIKKGTIIQSNHILALKTLGITKVKVKKLPNIIFFSTGNEISNKKRINKWQVRNSNNDYIHSLNQSFLFNFKDGGILRDNHSNLFKSKIKKILNSKIDIILTSGAVSAGKFDFIPKVIREFELSNYFKSVYIRPGKPVLFAKIKGKNKVIFGLPGNPISSSACFRFFVYPYIKNLLDMPEEISFKAILKNGFVKKKEFTQFVKSKIYTTKNGKAHVEILKGQESFRIRSFIQSNAWVMLPSGKSSFKKGDVVDCFFPNNPNKIFL